MTSVIQTALAPLAAIAQAYRDNALDDEARRFWGPSGEHENTTPPEHIQLYSGRGGAQLLTLQDCLDAETAIRDQGDVRKALTPLIKIADAYDDNGLDDEARKTWGRHGEHENTTPPEEIQLFAGRGGNRLLTLADAMNARTVSRAA